ncbi:MAG: ATP-binding protein [Methylococcales bacterium]|nr:ATP-binding protein [Methylococcales bacterium]
MLTPLQLTVLDVVLLALSSSLPLWFFALRPLSIQIIEEKQHLEKQTAANMSLLEALDSCNDMILLMDIKGNISYANQSFFQLTGWTSASLLKKNANILNSPNTDKASLKELQHRLQQHKPWSGRLLARRKGMEQIKILGQTTAPDPLECWVDVSITPIIREGENIGYVEVLRDISAQVSHEIVVEIEKKDIAARFEIANILQQTSPLKQRFIEVMAVLFSLKNCELESKGGVFIKDEADDFLDMFVMKGQFSDEFIRREKRIPLGACLCGRTAVSGKMIISDDCFCDPRHEHQFEGMKAHGHYIMPIAFNTEILGVLFLYTSPYPAKNQERIDIFMQVSEMMAIALLREKAQESLRLAHETTLLAAKNKSDFLANMSHEIRTPMNGVLGMLSILKETEMEAEQRDMVKTAANSANALLTIINDILNFSKLEAGKLELETIEFHLPDLVEDVCSLLAIEARHNTLKLTCSLDVEIQSYWQGDAIRIRQIVTNILGNAIKFTQQGDVFVRVKSVVAENGKCDIRFEIQDTGVGITPKIQKNLFKPFSQADSSTARHFGGTGLGLSICKDLVELMGGFNWRGQSIRGRGLILVYPAFVSLKTSNGSFIRLF